MLKFGFDVKRVFVCDMLENIQSEIEVLDNSVTLPIKNFEIVTLRIER